MTLRILVYNRWMGDESDLMKASLGSQKWHIEC